MSMPSPRKRLPVNPSVEHLKKQAKRRAKAESLELSQAQHELSREYGCRNWMELMHVVETMSRGRTELVTVRQQFEALPAAANRGDLAEVRHILEQQTFTQHDLDLALGRVLCAMGRGDRKNRFAIADLLVEHGADPDGQYGSNYGPIVFAACEGLQWEGIDYLLGHGADVTFGEIDTKYGKMMPLRAVFSTYVRGRNDDKHRCVDILMRHGARMPPEMTPAFLAVHRGDVEGLARLVDADPAMVTRRFADMPYGNMLLRGATLLHMAVEFGELEVAKLLVERGASVNARADVIDGTGGQTPLFHCAASWNGALRPVLEWLVNDSGQWLNREETGTFIREDKRQETPITALELARMHAKDGSSPEVRLLERSGPRVEDPTFRAAVEAIDAGDVERLKALLRERPQLVQMRAEESGTYVGPYFARPKLLWFVAGNPTRGVELPMNIDAVAEAIIDAGASREDMEYTLGLVASGSATRQRGVQGKLIETLVRRGADPSAGLAGALQEKEMEAAELLLKLGAKPDLRSAAGLGDMAALAAGLPGASDAEKRGALYNAALLGQAAAAELLVREGGVAVNARIGLGTTALHLAAWNGHRETIETLLALGADPTIKDAQYNSTPAGWARHNGRIEIAEMLS